MAEERIKKMDEDRKVKISQWKKLKKMERSRGERTKQPLYLKMVEIDKKKKQKEDKIIIKKIHSRKPLFKPIIQSELDEFAHQVDMIVSHLN